MKLEMKWLNFFLPFLGCSSISFHSRWYAANADRTTDYLSSFEDPKTKGMMLYDQLN